MDIKKATLSQMAHSDIRGINSTPADHIEQSVNHGSRIPKKHRAFTYIASSGINGVTENEILFQCRLSSGRNYVSEIERETGINFERLDEKNPDGIGSHYRYRLTCRKDATQVIRLINYKAKEGNIPGLSQVQVIVILSLYSDNTTS